jgi:integrase
MPIKKRGEIWYIDITTKYQRIRRSAETTSRKAAQELHDKLCAEAWEQDRLGIKPRHTFDEAALRWLDEKDYKRSIRDDIAKIEFFRNNIGTEDLQDITRDQIANLMQQFKTPATRNRYVALLRAIFRRARDVWDWVDKVPAFQTYVEPDKRIAYLTEDQFCSLLRNLPEPHRSAAVVAVSTGLRKSNIYGLRWDQVELERRMAWIHPDQAKAKRAIPVPLNDDAHAAIASQQGNESELVFPSGPMARKSWISALRRSGVPETFRWHDLRHTFASWHAMAGTPLHVIQELGGWRSAAMLQRYAHLSQDHLIGQAMNISIRSKPKLKAVA